MANFAFLKKYQRLQTGIMFDQVVNFGFAKVGFCALDKSAFWNQALINQSINQEQLKQVEELMLSWQRTPAIYFEKRSDSAELVNFLQLQNYVFKFEDSWMFYAGNEIDESDFNRIKKIESEKDLKIFLATFDKCYQKDDPQNVYGELGDYLKVTKKVWHKFKGINRLEYFLVYQNHQPVAVATLTNFEGLGYISNVGSLREVRGQGFGKLATLFAVTQSKKNGNTFHCLATEEGTYPNEFYKRIGFETKFTAMGWVKVK